jgi:CRP-like cAMP-binding protein
MWRTIIVAGCDASVTGRVSRVGGSLAIKRGQQARTMKLPSIFSDPSQFRDYTAGTLIFRAGEPGTEMFIVEQGEVDIVIDGQLVETIGPEHFFGEMALIDESPRSADAVARGDCKLLALNQRQFLFLVDEVPFFAIRMMRVLADRLRQANRH